MMKNARISIAMMLEARKGSGGACRMGDPVSDKKAGALVAQVSPHPRKH